MLFRLKHHPLLFFFSFRNCFSAPFPSLSPAQMKRKKKVETITYISKDLALFYAHSRVSTAVHLQK